MRRDGGGAREVIRRMEALSDPGSLEGMSRYGINTARAFGVSIPKLRALAKAIGKDHLLAGELWASGYHEARLLAPMVDDPRSVTARQMEKWVNDFDSWDVCDQCCGNLFDRTDLAYAKAAEWAARKEEFVKRAGFVLMASLAVHDKSAADEKFEGFLEAVERESSDGRNFVRKAVNWTLRQIGKRDRNLNGLAVSTARRISEGGSRTARWVASDALRELTSPEVRRRLGLPLQGKG